MRAIAACVAFWTGFSVLLGIGYAQESLALNSYTCDQFLNDSKFATDSTKVLKSLMMISWATGYATAFQQKVTGADATAFVLMAGTLGDICHNHPTQPVVQAIVDAVKQFATSSVSGPTSAKIVATPSIARTFASSGPFRAYQNYDLFGADWRKLQGVEQTACSSACNAEPTCKAYSYDRWNKYCYLKDELKALTFDPSSVTAVRANVGEPEISDAPIRMERRPGKKFSGKQLRPTYKATPQACESACAGDMKCVGFSEMKKEVSCQLYEEITTFLTDKNVTSAFKMQSTPQ